MLAVLSTTSVTRKQDSAHAGRGSADELARSRYRHITSLHSISTSMKLRMDTLQLTPQHDMDLMKSFSEITPGKVMQYFPSFRYLISAVIVSYFNNNCHKFLFSTECALKFMEYCLPPTAVSNELEFYQAILYCCCSIDVQCLLSQVTGVYSTAPCPLVIHSKT
jgi:hypothetical protein